MQKMMCAHGFQTVPDTSDIRSFKWGDEDWSLWLQWVPWWRHVAPHARPHDSPGEILQYLHFLVVSSCLLLSQEPFHITLCWTSPLCGVNKGNYSLYPQSSKTKRDRLLQSTSLLQPRPTDWCVGSQTGVRDFTQLSFSFEHDCR